MSERKRPHLMEVMTGSWSGQAVYVAAKLGIADMLADGPCPVRDLARATSVDADSLYRVIRALAGLGIFRLVGDGMVEITPLAEPLASDHPDSVRQFAIMVNEEVYQAFGGLIDSVRTGKPSFDDRFGMPVFTYYDAHPDVAATFHSAMNDWSAWDTPGIIAAYDFGRFKKVVDVGGGNGQFLSALLSRHPQLSGVLFDRPAAIAAARAGEGGPLLRCELVEGDFTIGGVPAGADLYTIKHVIDGWSDDGAAEVLATIRQAMADDGRVLVLDCVVADDNDASFVKWLDLLVMTTTQGRMRKVSDYPPIFAKAGLKLGRVIRVSDSVSILEGLVRKAR